MRNVEQYNPRNPQTEYQLLNFFESPQKDNGLDFYFLKENGYLLVYMEKFHTFPLTSRRRPGETKLIADQFEMPLAAIRWFIDVIEQKFFKPPEEGGLPSNKISYKETVAGEDLHVIRSMNAGCSHPGYEITNSSRRSHMGPDYLQCLQLSDPWLFQNGLMDFLKELADQHDRGEL